jgi:hypothetical protein
MGVKERDAIALVIAPLPLQFWRIHYETYRYRFHAQHPPGKRLA